jgi:hypothetical protein
MRYARVMLTFERCIHAYQHAYRYVLDIILAFLFFSLFFRNTFLRDKNLKSMK